MSLAVTRLTLGVLAGAIAATISGCSLLVVKDGPIEIEPTQEHASDPVPGYSDGFTSSMATVHDEYLATAAEFPEPLPAGESFPASWPVQGEVGAVMQRGIGEGWAYFYWRCAWSHQYLASDEVDDTEARDHALDMLERWSSTSYFREYAVEDPDVTWQSALIDPARAGDDSVLRAIDRADCGMYRKLSRAQ